MVLFEAVFYNMETQKKVKKGINFDVEIIDPGSTDFDELIWQEALSRAMKIVKEDKNLSLETLDFIAY